jgi:anaphase-promoting complex subunit 1
MLRTWIQYNRPSEPNFTHAGLLLAFGLHEHLRVLTMTDAYRYLSQVILFVLLWLFVAWACVLGL